MNLRAYAVLALSSLAAAAGAQYSLGAATSGSWGSSAPYDAGLFTPFQDLNALSLTEYTTLLHPHFPAHSVRVKQSRFCDGEVQAYSGYVDVGARHLFFAFFESRRDPDQDDVIFWTNGGPGGSSMLGLYNELGPCRVTGPNTTERFEYAWNNHANVFFVDQPIGVGFSYADYGEKISTNAEAGQDIAAFFVIFFEHFTKFKGRPFHMAGESFGGRYIPVFASAVYDRNADLVYAGLTPINLTSVMIGNGDTNSVATMMSYYDVQCGSYGFPKVTSISDCVRMKQFVPRCQKRLKDSCVDVLDHIDCLDAWEFCQNSLTEDIFTRRNPYDALRPCLDKPDFESCYPIVGDTTTYLNNRSVQEALGIDPHHGNYTWANWEVNARLNEDDRWFRAEHHLEALLQRGVKALIYVGDKDWICNWVGNERMTLELEWFGQDAFRSQPLRDWSVDGVVAGRTRSAGSLTFATIRDAGHMAPYDQPVRTLEVVNRWLAGQEL
ncbi:serine carboxypeptidase [Dichomitus squalens]|nr:serine carboxypeptidase [Dichomitus squalens]